MMVTTSRLRWILPVLVTGFAIRLVFLWIAGELEPYADESNYLFLAVLWNHFGLFSDWADFLWMPGYPLLLAGALRGFGIDGILAVKLLQVASSIVIGAATMLIAERLFDRRAGRLAGVIWCVYLPLVGYTHLLWSETLYLALFLPALYLLMLASGEGRAEWHVLVAGLLFGASIYFRGSGLLLAPVLALALVASMRTRKVSDRLSSALLFLLVITVCIAPWTMRNREVYGRFVPADEVGGRNAYMGANGRYFNLDYPAPLWQRVATANAAVHSRLLAPTPPEWSRSRDVNVIDRSRSDTRRGLEFLRVNPGYALKGRVKRLADWSAPMSFFVRHYGLERYQGGLDHTGVRRFLLLWALGLPMLVLAAAIPGFRCAARAPEGRWLLGAAVAFTLLTGALVMGMSRYRVPIEPLLIAFAAGFLIRLRSPDWGRKLVTIGVAAGGLILALLWWINWREWVAFVSWIW